MKKLIPLVFTAVLVGMINTPVLAKDINQDGDQSTDIDISTAIKPTYTVSIPVDVSVDFNAESTSFGTVRLDKAQIEPGKCVKVSLSTSGTLKNQLDAQKTIAYVIQDTNKNPFTFMQYLSAGEETGLNIMIKKSAWDTAAAGDYSDTVTFSVSYESTAP